MIDFSNREVKTVITFDNESKEPEWYEIRYCSIERGRKFKTDLDLFKWVVLDWGDDFKFKGRDWNCTDKGKEEFFWNVPDRRAQIITKSFDAFTFGTDKAEVINRLGKSRSINKPGAKRNQRHSTSTVPDA